MSDPFLLTDVNQSLTTLVVKHYNDLLGSETSERGRDEVTFFYVGDLFCIHLGTMYANFHEKIFAEISWKKFQIFRCSNVTTMKSLELFFRKLCKDFLLKIGILSAKVYTKKVPNIEVCNFIPAQLSLELCLPSKSL